MSHRFTPHYFWIILFYVSAFIMCYIPSLDFTKRWNNRIQEINFLLLLLKHYLSFFISLKCVRSIGCQINSENSHPAL